jgi:DNA polymerase-3 subunit gamma/tau
VATSQGIIFEDDALHIIAQKADGAMRDAYLFFDRVVSYCGTNLTRQAVTENLNVLDYETYITVTDLILENKIPELLMSFNDILSKGFDSHHFVSGLASHFRDLLVSKTPSTLSLLEVGEQAQKMYGQQSQKCSQDFFVKRNRYCK